MKQLNNLINTIKQKKMKTEKKLGRPFITLDKDKELDAIMARFVSFIVPLHELQECSTRTMPFLG